MTNNQDSIYVVGAGAIGKALSVFLKLAGRHVTLIRASVDGAVRECQTVTVEMPDGVRHSADIDVATLACFREIAGTIVLANKSFGNARLACSLKAVSGDSPIVLFQNGLGIEKPFVQLKFSNLYRCILYVTCQTLNPETVRFRPVGASPIGIENGNRDMLNHLVNHLSTPHFRFVSENDIQRVIWKKAIVNSVFNSICALLEIDNGIFYRNPESLAIARRVIAECVAIAQAKGIALESMEVEKSLLLISEFSDGQEISTLQDIRHNRRTEIETLNAVIAKTAHRMDKIGLVAETRLLGELTKLKSELKLRSPYLDQKDGIDPLSVPEERRTGLAHCGDVGSDTWEAGLDNSKK